MYPYSYTPSREKTEPTITASEKAMSPKPDQKLLDLLTGALADSVQDEANYLALSEQAPGDEARLLRSMALDATKHGKYLRDIYTQLTGEAPPAVTPDPTVLTYDEDTLSQMVIEELAGAAGYRQLMLSFLNRELRDLFFEMMTDEMMHAQQFQVLYTRHE